MVVEKVRSLESCMVIEASTDVEWWMAREKEERVGIYQRVERVRSRVRSKGREGDLDLGFHFF